MSIIIIAIVRRNNMVSMLSNGVNYFSRQLIVHIVLIMLRKIMVPVQHNLCHWTQNILLDNLLL